MNIYLEGEGINPTPEALPALFEEQAARYKGLFELFLEYSHCIERVTFFGHNDSPEPHGWRPWWKHPSHPTLFDVNGQAKPAFHAVIDAVAKR